MTEARPVSAPLQLGATLNGILQRIDSAMAIRSASKQSSGDNKGDSEVESFVDEPEPVVPRRFDSQPPSELCILRVWLNRSLPLAVVKGEMRSYQLEALNWLISLHDANINGILADEMVLTTLNDCCWVHSPSCRVWARRWNRFRCLRISSTFARSTDRIWLL